MTPDELDAIEAEIVEGDESVDDLAALIAALREAWAEVERLTDEVTAVKAQRDDERRLSREYAAAVARVRALRDEADQSNRHINGYGYVLLRPLRAALDGEAS